MICSESVDGFDHRVEGVRVPVSHARNGTPGNSLASANDWDNHSALGKQSNSSTSSSVNGFTRMPPNHTTSTRSLSLLIVASTLVATVGCQSMTSMPFYDKGKKKDASWSWFKKKEYQTPQSVNITWMHDVLTLPGKPATRGFGGRFFFYNEKTQAIPVDGDLTVYGFDDTDARRNTEDLSHADKKFRFTAEQLTSHFSEGQLGASYSVWIPWDAAPGRHKKIMLIPTFVSKDGKAIRGAAASLNLPGVDQSEEYGFDVMQSSGTVPASAIGPHAIPSSMMQNGMSPTPPTSLRTTTIQLPPKSIRRQVDHAMPGLMNSDATLQTQIAPMNPYSNSPSSLQQVAPESIPSSINGNASATQMQTRTMFNPPSSMPISQNAMQTRNTNGWLMPEFTPPNWGGQLSHSGPNSPPAPASTASQPSSYPAR